MAGELTRQQGAEFFCWHELESRTAWLGTPAVRNTLAVLRVEFGKGQRDLGKDGRVCTVGGVGYAPVLPYVSARYYYDHYYYCYYFTNRCVCTLTRVCTGQSLPGSSRPGMRHSLHLENDLSLLGPRFEAGLFNNSCFKPSVLTRLCNTNLITGMAGW